MAGKAGREPIGVAMGGRAMRQGSGGAPAVERRARDEKKGGQRR